MSELQSKAALCNFADTNHMIQNKIVFSVNSSLQQLLLREQNLTIDKCIQICRSSEVAQNHSTDIMPNTALFEKCTSPEIVTLSREIINVNAITSITIIFVSQGTGKVDRNVLHLIKDVSNVMERTILRANIEKSIFFTILLKKTQVYLKMTFVSTSFVRIFPVESQPH